MKSFSLAASLALALSIVPATVRANPQPSEATLTERVEMASRIIVGTPVGLRVVQFEDSKAVVEVKPEPKRLFDHEIELEIEVDEVLYPFGWKHRKTIRYYFFGGWSEVAPLRKAIVGKKAIFLMRPIEVPVVFPPRSDKRQGSEQQDEIFVASYGEDGAHPLQQKAAVTALVAARVRREARAKPAKGTGIKGLLVQKGFPMESGPATRQEPLENMELVIRRRIDKIEVARLKTGKRGQFQIDVVPGEYIVEPVIPFFNTGKTKFVPVASLVTVWSGAYSNAYLYYDGGH